MHWCNFMSNTKYIKAHQNCDPMQRANWKASHEKASLFAHPIWARHLTSKQAQVRNLDTNLMLALVRTSEDVSRHSQMQPLMSKNSYSNYWSSNEVKHFSILLHQCEPCAWYWGISVFMSDSIDDRYKCGSPRSATLRWLDPSASK